MQRKDRPSPLVYTVRDAMLARWRCVYVYVCMAQGGVLSKRLLYYVITQTTMLPAYDSLGTVVFLAKYLGEILMQSPPTGPPNICEENFSTFDT